MDPNTPLMDRKLRDELCVPENDRCLDAIGDLVTLPEYGWSTLESAAKFYEVSESTLKKLLQKNREEIDPEGYKILSKKQMDSQGIERNPKTRKMACLQRRTILRLGLLLRDSPRARQLRTYLLESKPPREKPSNGVDLARSKAGFNLDVLAQFRNAAEQIVNEIRNCNLRLDRLEMKQNEYQMKFDWLEERLQNLEGQSTASLLKAAETLPPRMAEQLRRIVREKGGTREGMRKIWKAFKERFRVDRYVLLAEKDFESACNWLNSLDSDLL